MAVGEGVFWGGKPVCYIQVVITPGLHTINEAINQINQNGQYVTSSLVASERL
jgi:hypothetical protein